MERTTELKQSYSSSLHVISCKAKHPFSIKGLEYKRAICRKLNLIGPLAKDKGILSQQSCTQDTTIMMSHIVFCKRITTKMLLRDLESQMLLYSTSQSNSYLFSFLPSTIKLWITLITPFYVSMYLCVISSKDELVH